MKNLRYELGNEKYFIGKLIFNVNGWLTKDEGYILYKLAQEAKGDIMEIGSYCGKSTICLCAGSETGTKQTVWAVDRFDLYGFPADMKKDMPNKSSHDEFWENIGRNGMHSPLNVIVDDTHNMTKQAQYFNLGMLFHDGSHEYEDVKHDLNLFLPRVIKEGYICVHDYNLRFPGVVKAVTELVEKGIIKNKALISSNMWVGVKQ